MPPTQMLAETTCTKSVAIANQPDVFRCRCVVAGERDQKQVDAAESDRGYPPRRFG